MAVAGYKNSILNIAPYCEQIFNPPAKFVWHTQSDCCEGHALAVGNFSGSASFLDTGAEIPTDDEVFSKYIISLHKLASIIKLRQNFVADAKFDIETALAIEFAKRFGAAEENAFLNGNGVNEPTGILNDTSGASVGVTAGKADTVTFDEVIKLFFSVDAKFRRNGTWLMSDETAYFLRMLKDANGNYLWRTSDDTILGKPVETSPFMPQFGSGTKPIVFGDLSYFWIFRRDYFDIFTIYQMYSDQGAIGFRASERIDGHLIDPGALKVLQNAELE